MSRRARPLFSAKRKEAFDKEALFYGEDLAGITLEGRGTIDGQADYEWRPKGDYPRRFHLSEPGRDWKSSAWAARPQLSEDGPVRQARPAPCAARTSGSPDFLPRFAVLDDASRTAAGGLVIDGVFIRSSLKDGVWADGIDPDGCQDVRIANCTIETGDDALVFYSMNWFGPALPCENITVTNCRLSSASSAIKFCDGNMNAIRNVTIDNCVITNSNRGLAFMNFDGGIVENVVLSNLTIDCIRLRLVLVGRRRAVPLQHQEAERGPQEPQTGGRPAGRDHSQRQDLKRDRPGDGRLGLRGAPGQPA